VAYDGGGVGVDENGEVDPTEEWHTYTNEEYGFSLKYPEGWGIEKTAENCKLFEEKYLNFESEHPMVFVRFFDFNGISLTDWLNNNSSIYIGDLDPNEVTGFLNRGKLTVNGYEAINFSYESMGETQVTTILKDGKVVSIEEVTLNETGGSVSDNYETIIQSFK